MGMTGQGALIRCLLVILVCLGGGCGWPLENPSDQQRCDPACPDGQLCLHGQCRLHDFGIWITIKPGSFLMGSPATEPCRRSNESQHKVELTHSFEITALETTQGDFKNLIGQTPSNFSDCGAHCPVESVTWHTAAAYCNALSSRKGLGQCYKCQGTVPNGTCDVDPSYSGGPGVQNDIYDCPGYRLPTEAEWEFAYRAGTAEALYSGPMTACRGVDANTERIGWFEQISEKRTHPVAQKEPNKLGLYDMAGNVGEWCHDWYVDDLGTGSFKDPFGGQTGTRRVVRGGSWYCQAESLRAASRFDRIPPNVKQSFTGFRVARTK